jgi:hypothetical protein
VEKEVFTMPLQTVLRGIFVIALYAFALWRIAAMNRGNRVIECGVISLVLLFAIGFAAKSNAPDWMVESLGCLMLLTCLLTLALFVLECYQALRRRINNSR